MSHRPFKISSVTGDWENEQKRVFWVLFLCLVFLKIFFENVSMNTAKKSVIEQRSVFQPFCCSGTLNKREGHSQNPMCNCALIDVHEVEATDSFP